MDVGREGVGTMDPSEVYSRTPRLPGGECAAETSTEEERGLGKVKVPVLTVLLRVSRCMKFVLKHVAGILHILSGAGDFRRSLHFYRLRHAKC